MLRVALVNVDRLHADPTTGILVDDVKMAGSAPTRGTTVSTTSVAYALLGLRTAAPVRSSSPWLELYLEQPCARHGGGDCTFSTLPPIEELAAAGTTFGAHARAARYRPRCCSSTSPTTRAARGRRWNWSGKQAPARRTIPSTRTRRPSAGSSPPTSRRATCATARIARAPCLGPHMQEASSCMTRARGSIRRRRRAAAQRRVHAAALRAVAQLRLRTAVPSSSRNVLAERRSEPVLEEQQSRGLDKLVLNGLGRSHDQNQFVDFGKRRVRERPARACRLAAALS